MNTPLYEVSVPVFIRMLRQLERILDKAAADAAARNVDPAALLASRLAPDMYPLMKQVQVATDAAVDGAARLAGVEPPAFDESERTFAELAARVRRAVAFLETLGPGHFGGAEERVVSWKARDAVISVKGTPYRLNHALPKFYFHVTMAYAILRHEGVALRKGDFMGKA
jgi:hypothetical protein